MFKILKSYISCSCRTAIGSSIVGVALLCGRSSCTNNTQSFTSHVSIVFEHDSSIKVLI